VGKPQFMTTVHHEILQEVFLMDLVENEIKVLLQIITQEKTQMKYLGMNE